MKKRIRHIILYYFTVVCPVLFTVSCIDTPDRLQQQSDTKKEVQMVFRVSAVDRATSESNEKMHCLRIIVLRESGVIERNIFIGFTGDPQIQYKKVLELQKREQKKIYLIANETSIKDLHQKLNGKSEGTSDFEEFINNIEFTPDYSKPLPMTSCYSVNIGTEKYIEKDFYVVYAATKFDIEFENQCNQDVTVSSFTLSSLAPSMYLMPHLTSDAGVYKKGEGENSDKLVKESTFNFNEEKDLYWIDWLRYVAEESYQDKETLGDKRGWILDYTIPEDAQKLQTSVDLLKTANNSQSLEVGKGKTEQMSTFYLPESRNLIAKKESTTLPLLGLEQEYMLNLTLNGATFSDIKLPNLRALFRDTHVLIHLNLQPHDVQCEVKVVPYAIINLEPGFGWDNLPDQDADPDPSVPGKRENTENKDPSIEPAA